MSYFYNNPIILLCLAGSRKRRLFVMQILDKSFSILMMKEDNNGNDLSALNNHVLTDLTKVFGGVTVEQTAGTWYENGILYQDQSYKFSCNYQGKLDNDCKQAIIKAIKAEFEQGGQLAVSIEMNNNLIILDQKDVENVKSEVLSNN